MMSTVPAPSSRSRVRQLPSRGRYDRDSIRAILNEGLVAHVAFVDGGQPFAIPMGYGVSNDEIFVHGATESRIAGILRSGAPVGISVTLLDGLVLAKSGLHHSMNYRSVAIFGVAREITTADEKWTALRTITEHLIPGRWSETRAPTPAELDITGVFALPLDEASAKVRAGPPVDARADLDLPHWAGVIPLGLHVGAPIPADTVPADSSPPAHVHDYRRPAGDVPE